MTDYVGRNGLTDIVSRLGQNETADEAQNVRIAALENAAQHIESGTAVFNGSGLARFDFVDVFDAPPVTCATAIDDDGRPINVQVDYFYTSAGKITGVRIVGDRIIELPGLLSGLFGFRVGRRDQLNGSTVNVIAIG